ncbi:adenylosuccinate synthetase [Candidatus Bathyarchaeota archaeon]|nr:adenylosuccinate synthetase [Candidatus Bathyarchaeota archaeon]MBS7630946.1 adenylosuccinate synthetase [Candidatus Bathyarchaeota archaeon]
MGCTVVVDGFFGDAGKGKIVSYLSLKDDAEICARAGVGPNAGHTVVMNNTTYKLRMIPCGFINPKTRLFIGPGVAVNPEILLKEIAEHNVERRVGIDPQCAIIENRHLEIDRSGHLSSIIQTTGSGTGPCNADRALRIAKMAREFPELKRFIIDVPGEVNRALDEKKNVIVEATQGTYISLYHGTYPFVTSKDVCASAACSDVGIGPTRVDDVVIVFKSYVTRVGAGDLPGELSPDEVKRRGWDEYGTVTGRLRRASPFNFDLAKRAVMLNGATQIALTKLDVLYPSCKGITEFEKLCREAKEFIQKIEEELKLKVSLIGTGPSLEEIIDRRKAYL